MLLLYPYHLYSKVINLQYEIDWKTVHIADIFWNISFDDKEYQIEFLIESYGLTDKIYNYESLTTVSGLIENENLKPLKYRSKTTSSNQDVFAFIDFNEDGSILNLDISKELGNEQIIMQAEFIEKYLNFTDPISQLSQYFLFNKNSDRLIIDGLNIYALSSKKLPSIEFKKNNPTLYTGFSNTLKLTFPFFQGLHKLEKKNNIKEIIMYHSYIYDTNIPVQYDIFSKKFNAKLYLKNIDVN